MDSAYERVNGARERLDELKPEIEAFRADIRRGIAYERRPETIILDGRQQRVVRGSFTTQVRPAPLKVSRLIGEVIQHLRIALDYLVYELTCFDAKGNVGRTQFPVADCEEEFKKLLKRYNLRGNLSGEHIAAIERLQPYKGCQWTKWLTTYSNPDKHETLTTVSRPVMVTPSPGSTEAILAGKEVEMEREISIGITFSDGTPVIEHLEQLISQVAKTLRDFESEFKR
ncbi:MAG: hypothetical protein Q7T33_09345 [Dehalococcoidia bacterium]|nr:hypothetical protein [Dehalococcoidia bacterium]